MNIISLDQSIFLTNLFTLDNILLIHKTMAWAKKLRQLFFFFKLNFLKTYDMVDWNFFFVTLAFMGAS